MTNSRRESAVVHEVAGKSCSKFSEVVKFRDTTGKKQKAFIRRLVAYIVYAFILVFNISRACNIP